MIRSLILSQSSDNLFQRFARTVVPARYQHRRCYKRLAIT
ncbi:hypothetical protein HID58_039154 [Brassica napus]|uniref:Uncharacterized protein n=1 Tax=Brassica napus TaxID=3708 RepID=A0ABQ8BS74_BRANA|nr:hypothetical protein HID58_039154 [Brassica napus]